MTELAFAKSFLTTLDSKPTKIRADHVEDPKTYPARSAYILPKMPHPLPKKLKTIPGTEPSLTVLLTSLRNPPIEISLSSQSFSTSILYLKETVSIQTSLPITKIRLLHNKKPVPDSKILKDLVGEEAGVSKIEFTVMIIGGAAALKVKEDTEEVEPKVVAPGEASVKEILGTEEFWKDLRGFLVQRLNDEKEVERVWALFQKAVS